jgi:AcrR family transcriptional regulator
MHLTEVVEQQCRVSSRATVNIGEAHSTLSTGVVGHTIAVLERFDVPEWPLDCTESGKERVRAGGHVFTEDGRLVATFDQESRAHVEEGRVDPLKSIGEAAACTWSPGATWQPRTTPIRVSGQSILSSTRSIVVPVTNAQAKQERRRGRPPGSRADERRQRILDIAAKLFAEYSGTPTSMDSIALAAGVTRTALYHYFPTKQDLVRAALMRSVDWQWWRAAIEDGHTLNTFAGRIHRLLAECVQQSLETDGDVYFALVSASREDEEIRGALRSYQEDMRESVHNLIVCSVSEGLLPSTTDCDALASAVLGLIWCIASGLVHTNSKRVLRDIELATQLAAGQIESFQQAGRRRSVKPSGHSRSASSASTLKAATKVNSTNARQKGKRATKE